MVIRGTVQNGHILPREALDLPDGTPAYILVITPSSPQRHQAALARLRANSVDVALPDEAFASEQLYEE